MLFGIIHTPWVLSEADPKRRLRLFTTWTGPEGSLSKRAHIFNPEQVDGVWRYLERSLDSRGR